MRGRICGTGVQQVRQRGKHLRDRRRGRGDLSEVDMRLGELVTESDRVLHQCQQSGIGEVRIPCAR